MAEIISRQKHYITNKWLIGVNYDPKTESITDADTLMTSTFPPVGVVSWVLTTVTEICACSSLWWIKWALGYMRSVSEKTNADGTITVTYTLTQP